MEKYTEDSITDYTADVYPEMNVIQQSSKSLLGSNKLIEETKLCYMDSYDRKFGRIDDEEGSDGGSDNGDRGSYRSRGSYRGGRGGGRGRGRGNRVVTCYNC